MIDSFKSIGHRKSIPFRALNLILYFNQIPNTEHCAFNFDQKKIMKKEKATRFPKKKKKMKEGMPAHSCHSKP